MISAIFIQNSTGDVLVSQIFREEVKPSIYSVFYKKIVTVDVRALKNPILTIGSTSFTYLKKDDLYYVAVSRYNVDMTVVLQYLNDLIEIIDALISNGNAIHDVNIMDNVLPIYEILGLTLDQGYIKTTELSFIQKHIVSPIYQSKERSTNSTFEVLNDDEELNALYHIDLNTECQENEALLQVSEFIHVPSKGKIKLIGELLVASKRSLTYEINSQVKGHDIHSIILSPLVKSTSELSNLKAEPKSNVACLLNYHGYCQLNELPIVFAGTMKQIKQDAYQLKVSIFANKFDISLSNLSIKIPVPHTESKVTTEIGQVYFEENEEEEENVIVWHFAKLSLSEFKDRYEDRITLETNITVNSSLDLNSWLIKRGNTLITYDFEGYNVGQFDVISYQTDSSLSKRFIKKVFLTYEVKV